jgi:prepilin-type N-terminal cleavage/methylation domain-containing protein
MRTTRATIQRASHSRRTSRRGFTLTESLIASVVLSMSVGAVSSAILASYEQDDHSIQRTAMAELSASTMEELTSLPLESSSTQHACLESLNGFSDTIHVANALSTAEASLDAPAAVSSTSGQATPGLTGSTQSVAGGTTGTATLTMSNGISYNVNASLINGRLSGALTTSHGSPSSTSSSSTSSTTGDGLIRTISVTRMNSLTGGTASTGKLALVTVTIRNTDGTEVQTRKLVSEQMD